jgi:hypothetical protein
MVYKKKLAQVINEELTEHLHQIQQHRHWIPIP